MNSRSSFVSEVDTQKLFDYQITEDCAVEARRMDGVGVYALFHKPYRKSFCLYVGASVNVYKRASRFFSNAPISENIYLAAILAAVKKSDLYSLVKITPVRGTDDLGLVERDYRDKLRPACNIARFNYDYNTANWKKLYAAGARF